MLGTDNYFRCAQDKWDQHIGERPPRTRGVPGMSAYACNPVLQESYHAMCAFVYTLVRVCVCVCL